MSIRSFVLYGLFFSGMFLLFAVVQFPHDRAALMIAAFLENALPGTTVHPGRTALAFPPGLALINTDIEWNNRYHLRPGRLVISVHPVSLLRQKKQIHFMADINGGQVRGTVTSPSFLTPPFSERTLKISGVEIKGFHYAGPSADMEISFKADGFFSYTDDRHSGTGQLILSAVTLGINHPVFKQMGIFPLEFDHLSIEFSIDPAGLSVEQCMAKGPAMNVTLNGKITPEDRFDNSPPGNGRISLKGYLQPGPSHIPGFARVPGLEMLFSSIHEKGIPIHIQGTVDHPEIAL